MVVRVALPELTPAPPLEPDPPTGAKLLKAVPAPVCTPLLMGALVTCSTCRAPAQAGCCVSLCSRWEEGALQLHR